MIDYRTLQADFPIPVSYVERLEHPILGVIDGL
ncbi:MAG: hypothetical protein SP4CHLAM1_16850 [Chlamydiia bacterium]|nr:hypothetical protein [Chlamydiia bacterium]MCH9629885.1 hypothetical protein [Chlamydiia bacterium]